MVQERLTAYKVWIKDLLKSEFHKEEGEWDPNYVLINDKKISRINIIASVVSVFINDDRSVGNLEIDDGSSTIRVMVWGDGLSIIDKVDIGNLILLIGRVRMFNEEIYITPEIIKVMDMIWARIRKLELEREYGKLERYDKENINVNKNLSPEKVFVTSENKRKKILNLIGMYEEANYEKIVTDSGIGKEEAYKIINELLKEGEIYQSRPGYLKII